jgi:hypothetical protein
MWFGIHFGLWKTHGGTPLWLVFSPTEWGRADEVRRLIEPWAAKEGFFTTFQNDEFAVALDIACGEGKDRVVGSIVDDLKEIAEALHALRPKLASPDDA